VLSSPESDVYGGYKLDDGLTLGAVVVGANKNDYFGPVNQARVIATHTKTL
jgi:hypothetical protein